jgi:hemerythrin superfamily protein
MNAIRMLEQQHRAAERLFEELEGCEPGSHKQRVFDQLADALAVHTTIEERHFYPAVRDVDTDETLLESTEEHLAMKRVLADLLDLDDADPTFDAKLKVLKDEVAHHVDEEERGLFPTVAKLFDEQTMDDLGAEMQETADALMAEGSPREAVPEETDHAALI